MILVGWLFNVMQNSSVLLLLCANSLLPLVDCQALKSYYLIPMSWDTYHEYAIFVFIFSILAQLMPLPLTVYYFSKIQIGFTFLVPAHPGKKGKGSEHSITEHIGFRS